MLTPAGEQALAAGKTIRVASPVAGEVTDDLARLIVGRWCEGKGIVFDPAQMHIESAGFEHLKNIQAGFDGAWLCFANFEGVEAQQRVVNRPIKIILVPATVMVHKGKVFIWHVMCA